MAEYNESQINSNETERISAEQERIENEAKRQTNETEREARETTRQSNETTRISKEAERLAEEVNRVEAEASRVNAEQGRVEAENIRAEFYEGFNSELEGLHAKDEELSEQLADIESKLKVNVNDFKKYVVDENGEEDWHLAIQNAIDFVYNNGGGVVELNAYNYKISKPILLNSSYDNNVALIGVNRGITKITKHNNNLLGEGEYSNIDAIIILSSKNIENIGYHKIKNISLEGCWHFSEDGNHSHVEYGIYANKNINYVEIRNIHIFCNKGIVFNYHLWQSIISDFRLHTWTRGIYLGGHGSTSNLIEKGYVMNCRGENAISYQFTGNYSSCNSLAADNCGGVIYRFWKADWVANGIGCESMSNCDTVVEVQNKSNVVINSPTLFVPTKENSNVFHCYVDSNLIVNGGSIGEKLNPHINNKCKLINLGWKNTTVKLNGIAIYDTFELSSEKVDDDTVNAFIDGKNIFFIEKNINGDMNWVESSKGSDFSTYYLELDLPTYVKLGRLSDEPTFEVVKSAIPITPVKNKPIYFTNISSHSSGGVNALFLTLPNTMISNVENLKSFLNDYPITIKIKSLKA